MTLEPLLLSFLDDHRAHLNALADAIWRTPEVALTESFASRTLATELEAAGFRVVWGAGGMPTAFVAEWGAGGPTIGILGEYDALPGLSQDATPERRELVPGGAGHGCGHNLYGVAALGAALASKHALAARGMGGTVRYYGCPAEETLMGKTFMARDGVFDDLDAAITWHPSSINGVWANGSSLAMNSFKVHFHGVSAHGAADPHRGRSALDAAMLMDVGVNYLREHVPQQTRIHSVISDGGRAPNVVPPEATIWYFVRAPKRVDVEAVYARVLECARGAAIMTGTTYDVEFLTGCYDLLPNDVISRAMLRAMEALGPVAFDQEEFAFARALQSSFTPESIDAALAETLARAAAGTTVADVGAVLCTGVIHPSEQHHMMYGSTEVADVSWITPTGNLLACCAPLGTPGHSWQITAASGSAVGRRGMDYAARAMAVSAFALFTDAALLAAARAEFAAATGGRRYVSPLPADARPK